MYCKNPIKNSVLISKIMEIYCKHIKLNSFYSFKMASKKIIFFQKFSKSIKCGNFLHNIKETR